MHWCTDLRWNTAGRGNFATAGWVSSTMPCRPNDGLPRRRSRGDEVRGAGMVGVRTMAAVALSASALTAWADEAAIRKNLAERLPNFPPIDEVSKTPIPGLYELRVGTDLLYTDEQGQYVIQGSVIDTKTRTNLTEAR